MTIREGSTFRARFTKGVLQPLEPLELPEGAELTVSITAALSKSDADWLSDTEGGWLGLVDCEKLKRDIYESRLLITRPEPKL